MTRMALGIGHYEKIMDEGGQRDWMALGKLVQRMGRFQDLETGLLVHGWGGDEVKREIVRVA